MVMNWEYPARKGNSVFSWRRDMVSTLPQREVGRNKSLHDFFTRPTTAIAIIEEYLRGDYYSSNHSHVPSLAAQILPVPACSARQVEEIICASSPEDAESGEELSFGGDKRQQEVLAQIAMLQAQKVRITNFLDERSAYLAKFAKDATPT
jgi:hypothetical protein